MDKPQQSHFDVDKGPPLKRDHFGSLLVTQLGEKSIKAPFLLFRAAIEGNLNARWTYIASNINN